MRLTRAEAQIDSRTLLSQQQQPQLSAACNSKLTTLSTAAARFALSCSSAPLCAVLAKCVDQSLLFLLLSTTVGGQLACSSSLLMACLPLLHQSALI